MIRRLDRPCRAPGYRTAHPARARLPEHAAADACLARPLRPLQATGEVRLESVRQESAAGKLDTPRDILETYRDRNRAR